MPEVHPTRARMRAATFHDQAFVWPLKKRVYLSSGTPTFAAISIAAPGAAPSPSDGGSGVLTGELKYVAKYVDSSVDEDSIGPSPIGTVTVTAKQVTVGLSSINSGAPSRATHVDIYRKSPNYAHYYWIARVAVGTSSYTDNNSETSVLNNDTLANVSGDIPDGNIVFRHGARLFVASASHIYWSEADRPEQWDFRNNNPVAQNNGYDITALNQINGRLIIFKERGAFLYSYEYDPSTVFGDGVAEELRHRRGAANHECVVAVNDALFGMDWDGWWYMASPGVLIDKTAKAAQWHKRINWAQVDKFSGFESGGYVIWSVAIDGATECNFALAIDWQRAMAGDEDAVFPLHTHHGVRGACRMDMGTSAGITDMARRPVTVVADSGGTVLAYDQLLADGVPSDLCSIGTIGAVETDGGVTVVTRGTASGDVNRPFQSADTSRDVSRLYVVFQVNGQWSSAYRIASVVDADSFRLAVDVTSSLSVGAQFVIGQIDGYREFPIFDFGEAFPAKKLGKAEVAYVPSPIDYDISIAADPDNRGYQSMQRTADEGKRGTTVGSPDRSLSVGGHPMTAGGSGLAKLPMAATVTRRLRFRVKFDKSNQPVDLLRLTIPAMLVEEENGK